MLFRQVLDQRLDIAADGIGVCVLRAKDAAVLAVGPIAMAFYYEAVLHLEGAFRVVGPFRDFPGFSGREVQRAGAVGAPWVWGAKDAAMEGLRGVTLEVVGVGAVQVSGGGCWGRGGWRTSGGSAACV